MKRGENGKRISRKFRRGATGRRMDKGGRKRKKT